jgi:xanthine dehydrogenase accessory factor
MRRETLDEIRQARVEKRPAVLLTNLMSNDQTLTYSVDINKLSPDLHEKVDGALRADRSTVIDTATGPVFIQVFNPPLRLIIVGAVHIAQALAPMAGLAGYAVTVIDPRTSFASDARFPALDVDTAWPDDALTALAPDRRTAVVTLSHDPKLDDPALTVALRSDCFYIGSLGSTRTHAARVTRLAEAGFTDDAMSRIHGPIGLDIGAKTPAEIAIAIMGEVTRALRRGPLA